MFFYGMMALEGEAGSPFGDPRIRKPSTQRDEAGVTLVDTQVQDALHLVPLFGGHSLFFASLSISERFRGPFGILGLLPSLDIHSYPVRRCD